MVDIVDVDESMECPREGMIQRGYEMYKLLINRRVGNRNDLGITVSK